MATGIRDTENRATASEIQLSLLTYQRLSNLYALTGEAELDGTRRDLVVKMKELLTQAEQNSGSSPEAQLVAAVAVDLDRYLRERERVEAQGARVMEILRLTTPTLNATLLHLETLRALNDAQVRGPVLGNRFSAYEMGIYGVMSHGVLRERREIGIRKALGAQTSQIVGMVARRGAVLTGLGLVLGIPLTILVHRGFTSAVNLFYADAGYEAALLSAVALASLAIASSYLPARGAARVRPTRALSRE